MKKKIKFVDWKPKKAVLAKKNALVKSVGWMNR